MNDIPDSRTTSGDEPGPDPGGPESAGGVDPAGQAGSSDHGKAAGGGYSVPPNPQQAMLVRGLVLVVVLVLAGIGWYSFNGGPPEGDGADAQAGPAGPAGPADAANPTVPAVEVRTSLEGNWVLIISQANREQKRFEDLCCGVFKFTKAANAKGSYTGELLSKTPVFPQAVFNPEQSSVTDSTLHLVIDIGRQAIDFEGVFSEGVVRGNVVMGNTCLTARLLAFPGSKVPDDRSVVDSRDRPLFEKTVKDAEEAGIRDQLTVLRRFMDLHPGSALALDICTNAVMNADPQRVPEKDFLELADDYYDLAGRWGKRRRLIAQLDVCHRVTFAGYSPKIALDQFDEIAPEFAGDLLMLFRMRLETIRQVARGRAGRDDAEAVLKRLGDEKSTTRTADLARLNELHEQFPFDHFITFGLADQVDQDKQVDRGIELYGELACLPLMQRLLEVEWSRARVTNPLPSDSLGRLWEQKHGNKAGVPDYLDQVYEKAVRKVAGSAKPIAAVDGAQVALCELFSGVRNDLCIAPELATSALETIYPRSRLIVLRYHQHTRSTQGAPEPDPLTTDVTRSRFNYYLVDQPHALLLNGRPVPGIVGPLFHTSLVYERLRKQAEKAMASKATCRLKLTAVAEGGELKVTAEVSGLEELDQRLRLRLVLAEESISYIAFNGVRRHDMVVRFMIGGPDGFSPADGKLAHAGTVDLFDMKQTLVSSLDQFERVQGMIFPVKPLDLKPLVLVGIVQHNDTHEILQTAAVKVSGNLVYEKRAEKPADKKKADVKKGDKKKGDKKKDDVKKGDKKKGDKKKDDKKKGDKKKGDKKKGDKKKSDKKKEGAG